MIQIVGNRSQFYETVPIERITDDQIESKIVIMRQTLPPSFISYGIMVRDPFNDRRTYFFVNIDQPIRDVGNAWHRSSPSPRLLMAQWGFDDPHHEFFVFDSVSELAIWLANEHRLNQP